jgi:osmotically-inducible protein OsmY
MTTFLHPWIRATVVVSMFLGVAAAAAQSPRPAPQKPATSQGTRTDAETTKLIRQAIQRDKSLSVAARKVQVITLAGYVTLKGSVRSPEERAVVEAKAAQVAGDDYVMSQLTVPKPAGKARKPGSR